jgi:hypothetical protein
VEGVIALNLSICTLLEALGGAAMGLQLGHGVGF